MAKDERLYMRYPIDFAESPIIEALSDAAFRVFVTMNGYSRQHKLDGVIPIGTARRRWRRRALDELVKSHPTRPLVFIEGDNYVIREYASHQQTNADIEELRAKRAAAGARGGKAAASAKANARQLVEQGDSNREAESRVKSQESRDDMTYGPESGPEGDGAALLPDSVIQRANTARIGDLSALQSMLAKAVGQPVAPLGAVVLAEAIVSKSARPVGDVDAYVAVSCRQSPHEVQQAYFDLDLGAFSEMAS